VRDQGALARIKALAIPPAYTDVWICRHANGHIQATGRDARGRKQYRYHPEFRQARESTKFAHMMTFAEALPGIRVTVQEHMGRRGLPREKVLATVVHLLETTLIRVGNDDYAKQNKSYGLTTLRDPHVKVEGRELKFRFKGKSNKVWELAIHDRRVAKIVKACQDLPGQELFQYLDEDGVQRDVTSADVNAYLREITGRDITAKDFRTWSGTVLAAMALREFEAFDSEAVAKRNVRAAIERVAERLGNTPTICRKCYIHPEIVGCYLEGELLLQVKDEVQAALRDEIARLRPEETAVLGLLQGRLARAEQQANAASRKPRAEAAKPAKGRSVKGGKSRAGKTAARRAA
jgi:DNA topoisomerase-1